MFNEITREIMIPDRRDQGIQLYPLGVEFDGRVIRPDASIELPSILPVRFVLPDCRSALIGSFGNIRIEDAWIVGDPISKGWGAEMNLSVLPGTIVDPVLEWASVELEGSSTGVAAVTRGSLRGLVLFVQVGGRR